MKSGGFQVKPLDFLGMRSFVKWNPVSAVGQGEGRGQGSLHPVQAGGCRARLKEGQGPRPHSQAPVTSRAGELPLEGSVVGQPHPEEDAVHLHYAPAAQCLMPGGLVGPRQSSGSMLRMTFLTCPGSQCSPAHCCHYLATLTTLPPTAPRGHSIV